MCSKSNGTYLDCPIANYHSNASFIVTIHNPSLVDRHLQALKVPNGGYSVKAWNDTTHSFQTAPGNIFCYNITLEN